MEPANAGMQRVSELFSRAPLLAEMDDRVGMGLRQWELEVLARHFPPSGRVLDVGCGAGREAIALAKRGYEVVGADVSEAEIGRARLNAAAAEVRVEWVLTDGIRVPTGPFDAVVMWAQVIGNIESRADQLALLANCLGALKPGGVLSVSGHHGAECQRQWPTDTDESWLYPWGRGELRYHLFTPQALEALLREAGAEVVATEVPDCLTAILHTVARRPG